MIKKIILGIIGFLVIVGIIGAASSSKKEPVSTQINQQKAEAQTQIPAPSPLQITATELADDFDANQVAAEAKWKDKLVEFSATISNITDSGISFYNVASKDFSATQISCRVEDKNQLMNIKNGQTVTVQGVVGKQTIGVIEIKNCQVVTSTSTTITTSTKAPKQQTQQAQQPAQKTEVKSSGITMDQFNRIQEGMSYQEVVSILGFAGEVGSSSDVGGIKTILYTWKGNSLGANMNVMFQNDRMVSKAQFGLK